MVSVKDVAEVIKLLGEVVKNTREIVEAVNDGKDYLKTRFPDAKQDLSELVSQMQITIVGLADATKIISAFRFVYDGVNVDYNSANRELARFNDYIIAQSVSIKELRNNIGALKGKCEEINELRDKLDARTETKAWGSMFGLLGEKARQRAGELHAAISNFYADDQKVIEHITATLDLAEHALNDVDDSLGPPGMASPFNIVSAAHLLGYYAMLFKSHNGELNKLAEELEKTKNALA